MSLGKRIKSKRLANRMSQTDLTIACGWENQSRISGYETGTREPSQADIRILAEALKTTPAELVYGVEISDFSPIQKKVFSIFYELEKRDEKEALRLLKACEAYLDD